MHSGSSMSSVRGLLEVGKYQDVLFSAHVRSRVSPYMYVYRRREGMPVGGHSDNGVVHMRDQRNAKKRVVF